MFAWAGLITINLEIDAISDETEHSDAGRAAKILVLCAFFMLTGFTGLCGAVWLLSDEFPGTTVAVKTMSVTLPLFPFVVLFGVQCCVWPSLSIRGTWSRARARRRSRKHAGAEYSDARGLGESVNLEEYAPAEHANLAVQGYQHAGRILLCADGGQSDQDDARATIVRRRRHGTKRAGSGNRTNVGDPCAQTGNRNGDSDPYARDDSAATGLSTGVGSGGGSIPLSATNSLGGDKHAGDSLNDFVGAVGAAHAGDDGGDGAGATGTGDGATGNGDGATTGNGDGVSACVVDGTNHSTALNSPGDDKSHESDESRQDSTDQVDPAKMV